VYKVGGVQFPSAGNELILFIVLIIALIFALIGFSGAYSFYFLVPILAVVACVVGIIGVLTKNAGLLRVTFICSIIIIVILLSLALLAIILFFTSCNNNNNNSICFSPVWYVIWSIIDAIGWAFIAWLCMRVRVDYGVNPTSS